MSPTPGRYDLRATPRKPPRGPVNPKVKAATVGAGVGTAAAAAVLELVDAAFYNGPAEPSVPTWLAGLIVAGVPAAVAFVAGWLKNELPRG